MPLEPLLARVHSQGETLADPPVTAWLSGYKANVAEKTMRLGALRLAAQAKRSDEKDAAARTD